MVKTGREPERSGVSNRSLSVQRDWPTSDILYASIRLFLMLLAFIAMVSKCTAGMERKVAENRGCGGSCRQVLGCARLDVRVTGCGKWLYPILPSCWPEVGLNRFKCSSIVYIYYYFKKIVCECSVRW